MRTLIAICGRDRQALVERCLTSVREARAAYSGGDLSVVFNLDPCADFTDTWLWAQGCDRVARLDLPRDMVARDRVSAMRCDAAAFACEARFDRIAFLDSDVLLDRRYFERLDELWAVLVPSWGGVSLGNYPGYERPGYLLRRLPEFDASVRTHGLGASLAFRVDQRLHDAAKAGVPHGAAWDSCFSRTVADRLVLTSDHSYVRHLGRFSGLCAAKHFGLDFHRFTPDLEHAT